MIAYSWSAEEHGATMIVARNDQEWMEVMLIEQLKKGWAKTYP